MKSPKIKTQPLKGNYQKKLNNPWIMCLTWQCKFLFENSSIPITAHWRFQLPNCSFRSFIAKGKHLLLPETGYNCRRIIINQITVYHLNLGRYRKPNKRYLRGSKIRIKWSLKVIWWKSCLDKFVSVMANVFHISEAAVKVLRSLSNRMIEKVFVEENENKLVSFYL